MSDRPVRKRWVEAADHRHATEGAQPTPGDVVGTLCGQVVTVIVAVPGRYAPECERCDREWRVRDGIPLRPFTLAQCLSRLTEKGRES